MAAQDRGSDGFFKGLIQAAVAFHEMREDSARGMRIHLDRSLEKLKPYAPVFLGVVIDAFVQELERCRDELESNRFPVGTVPVISRLLRQIESEESRSPRIISGLTPLGGFSQNWLSSAYHTLQRA